MNLNNDSYIESGIEHYEPFELISTGNYTLINFMGVVVWSSEFDEREYNKETCEYEPLIDYVLRESKKILKDLTEKMNQLNQIYQ